MTYYVVTELGYQVYPIIGTDAFSSRDVAVDIGNGIYRYGIGALMGATYNQGIGAYDDSDTQTSLAAALIKGWLRPATKAEAVLYSLRSTRI